MIDKEECIRKAEELLKQPTCKKIPDNPTTWQKTKLMYLIGGRVSTVLWAPQDTQARDSPEAIVSSRGTVTYSTAKELAKILKPPVGMSPHHVVNTRDFVEQLKGIRVQQEEYIISYDVKALFTSGPIQPVINIIKNKLAKDKDLQQRTSMAIHYIISLLEFCLKSTYFVLQGQYYEKIEGAAMGSPVSPIVANLFMEEFETKALSTSPHTQVCEKDLLMTPLL